MKRFIEKHGKNIIGVLSGYDRLIFRGGIKGLMYEKGMAAYLNYKRILLKDFKDHALTLTAELKEKKVRDKILFYKMSPSVSLLD
jgi:hypothetical protein